MLSVFSQPFKNRRSPRGFKCRPPWIGNTTTSLRNHDCLVGCLQRSLPSCLDHVEECRVSDRFVHSAPGMTYSGISPCPCPAKAHLSHRTTAWAQPNVVKIGSPSPRSSASKRSDTTHSFTSVVIKVIMDSDGGLSVFLHSSLPLGPGPSA